MIYLSYFLGNIVIMRARVRGWPKTTAPFRLGRWGVLVNIVALIWAIYYLVVGRKKEFALVLAPSEDDAPLTGSGAAPPV